MNPVTVIIPTYNRLHTLVKVLKGLEKQSVKDFEVIVADDGSIENVENGVGGFRDTLNIRYYRNPKNGGRASACNLGLGQVKTPLVVFLDDDLVPKRHWLKAHLDFHLKHPEEHYATYGKISWGPLLKKSPLLFYLETEGRYKNCSCRDHGEVMWDVPTGNTSFKTNFLIRNKGFNPGFTEYGQEDLEFGKRLFKDGLVCLFNTKAFAWHLHELTEVDFLRLAEKDGYSAAYFQSLDPDFKWGQSAFIAEKVLEEEKILTGKNSSPERDLKSGGGASFERSARDAAFRGMERFMFENLKEYPELKKIAFSEKSESFLDWIQFNIQGTPTALSIACYLLELRFGMESVLPAYEKILERYPHFIYARKKFYENLNDLHQYTLLDKLFFPSFFKGHPELDLFCLILEIQRNTRDREGWKAVEKVNNWMKLNREWKKDPHFVYHISKLIYEAGNLLKSCQIIRWEKHAYDYHYFLASELENQGKIRQAETLFRHVDESGDIERKDIKASAAFHLGRIYMKKKTEKSIRYFEKTLLYNPDHGKAREYLDLLKRN